MNREYHFRVKGEEGQIRKALDLLDGDIQTTATDAEAVNITWKPKTDADPLQKIADILKEGNYDDGILLLESFLSDDPTNTTV